MNDRCLPLQDLFRCIRRKSKQSNLAVDACRSGLLTQGTSSKLIEGISACWRIVCMTATKSYLNPTGVYVVILTSKSRKHQRPCDKDLHALKQLVKNAFLHLKRWIGIAIVRKKLCIIFDYYSD